MASLDIRIVQGTIQMADVSPCLKVDHLTYLRANLFQQGENNGYLPRVQNLDRQTTKEVQE